MTKPATRTSVYRMRLWMGIILTWLAIGCAGCGSFHGPSLDCIAPRVTGNVVDDNSGRPVRYALVGRKLWSGRQSTGGFLKGAEELMLMHDYVRTDAAGSFQLPKKRVALLFSFGDIGLNLRLAVQHSGYGSWQTNFPYVALATNSPSPELHAGEVRLRPR